jgi:predicted RNase H-like HicB family nuclease
MRRYTILLIPDPDEGGFTVLVPALPGCITEADTEAELLENARDAIRLFLDDVEAMGEPLPEERAMPELAAVVV